MKQDAATRSASLDATKGLSIILVVFGHAIQRYMADFTNIWYWAAIWHFHMALFMAISGYLACGKLDATYLSRRFLQLIPPYIVWSFVYYYWSSFPFSGLGGIYQIKGGFLISFLKITANLELSGLWFLPALFVLCVLMYLVKGKPQLIIVLTITIYAISQLPLPHGLRFLHSSMTRIAWFFPFYVLGYFVSRYRRELHALGLLKWFALIAFPICFVLGHGTTNVQPIYSWGNYTFFMSGDIVFPLYRFIMSLLGIGMTFAVVELLLKVEIIRRVLRYLGFITLGIYSAHTLWLNIGIGTGIAVVLSATLIALLLSVALIWIFQRHKITEYLLLGGAQKVRLGFLSHS